ncbi:MULTISPECIES: nuclease-related domain-containing protein [unclassified Mesobacillus]|uniref:nuclease-related domain-containing protein n=1 Tax=unclassified Mesobacillus TaxID=2675270 RepID=UPI00203BD2D2|nr:MULTISPECIES: nuclease-related domain-containing protein [unclassified Mesobacillus]MCM3124779.1 NERD domain-containing protein [Mesobacillus sp. MER 33]MCM3232912.1 NERD domain-containing protein [Mesobacillus sp. MER 48]
MLLKKRTESNELVALRYLNTRMELAANEKFHLVNLEKGYKGEVEFDRMTENLPEERYIMDDLLLQVNNSYFQIDKVIISGGLIHLLDVKYHEGDFYLESDKFYSLKSGKEYKNPVIQLKRSETLFRQLLQNLKLNYLIQASVVFNNPEFTLYQAPMDQPIILPTQINRFLKELTNTPSKLDENHKILAQKLLSLHHDKNPFTTLPEYDYDQMEKGMHCRTCGSFNTSIKIRNLVCGKCGSFENVEQSIVQQIEEFKLLFPERKITTQSIYEWCNIDLNKRRITRVLKKNYSAKGTTSDTYYE